MTQNVFSINIITKWDGCCHTRPDLLMGIFISSFFLPNYNRN